MHFSFTSLFIEALLMTFLVLHPLGETLILLRWRTIRLHSFACRKHLFCFIVFEAYFDAVFGIKELVASMLASCRYSFSKNKKRKYTNFLTICWSVLDVLGHPNAPCGVPSAP